MASIDQCSVHGQLAARLCFMLVMMNDAKPWMDVMPTPEDFEHCMPLVWPLQLRQKLSEGAQKLLEKQKKKFEHDLNIVRPKFYSVLQELDPQRRKMGDIAALHTHAWLLVNSRCFYWDYPNSRGSKATAKIKKMRQDRNDCMALCPVLDCFNHSSTEDVRRSFMVACFQCANDVRSVKLRSTAKATLSSACVMLVRRVSVLDICLCSLMQCDGQRLEKSSSLAMVNTATTSY